MRFIKLKNEKRQRRSIILTFAAVLLSLGAVLSLLYTENNPTHPYLG